ncbi:MAG: MarR family transcriptional regulator [Desulfuromonadales bacterium]|nr:MarR family transcriptional regulator [Desulfuromonadales bacterium]
MNTIRDYLQVFVRRFGLLAAACCDECCGEQVSMAQSHILFEVRRQPCSSMQRIADELGLDVTTFSRQVKGLEGKGLVARRVSPDDRRVSLLDLTPAGSGVLDRIDVYMEERVGRIFARMSAFEQETVTRSLGLLNNALAREADEEFVEKGIIACCK